ncbi:MAG: hypothetical protein ACYCOU_14860 [Sulfobacillus sp.]
MKETAFIPGRLASSNPIKNVAMIGFVLWGLAGCATTTSGITTAPERHAAIDRLPGDRLIVPGQRVGLIQIGETIDDAVRLLGPAQTASWNTNPGYPNNHYYKGRSWPQYGLIAYYNPSDGFARIIAIFVLSSRWKTVEGLHYGMPYNEALSRITLPQQSAFQPYCHSAYCWAQDVNGGMMVQSNSRTGPITVLRISAPGFAP